MGEETKLVKCKYNKTCDWAGPCRHREIHEEDDFCREGCNYEFSVKTENSKCEEVKDE